MSSFRTPMTGRRAGQTWRPMISKHDGVCSACKEAIATGERIVVKQVGSRLNARHERCKDATPVATVTQVEDNVYRVSKRKVKDDSTEKGERTVRSFDPNQGPGK